MSDRMVVDGGPRVIACHECGTVHRVRKIPIGAVADCGTCGSPVYRGRRGHLESVLALNLAALVLFTVAQLYPFMSLMLEGQSVTVTLLTGSVMLYRQGMWPLAILVFAVASFIPGVRLVASIYVLGPSLAGHRPPFGARVFRLIERLHPWAMMEVYLLGVIVAYVKLSDLAMLELDIALFAFVGLILLMITAEAILEPRAVWERFGQQARLSILDASDGRPPLACHACDQLVLPIEPESHDVACPRCEAPLHRRKPAALQRTWALLVAAAILYIPANTLPVMQVIYFGSGQPDTILSGVRELAGAGMWPVALLVFFASITVPCLKLAGLSWLLLSVQFGWLARPRLRTFAYRIIEGIGRWSMVDIFMISILVGLVDLGALASIEPGAGALCFAAVVILTMLASASFDPRLIWDVREAKGERDAVVRV